MDKQIEKVVRLAKQFVESCGEDEADGKEIQSFDPELRAKLSVALQRLENQDPLEFLESILERGKRTELVVIGKHSIMVTKAEKKRLKKMADMVGVPIHRITTRLALTMDDLPNQKYPGEVTFSLFFKAGDTIMKIKRGKREHDRLKAQAAAENRSVSSMLREMFKKGRLPDAERASEKYLSMMGYPKEFLTDLK